MFVPVRPLITQVHLSTIWPDVGKGVDDMCQILDWKVLGIVISAVDRLSPSIHAWLGEAVRGPSLTYPVHEVCHRSVATVLCHDGLFSKPMLGVYDRSVQLTRAKID